MANLLLGAEKTCRRLFLDYHGLKIMHTWMSELGLKELGHLDLKLIIEDVLAVLAVPHKTMLVDSQVWSTVTKWSAEQVPEPVPSRTEPTTATSRTEPNDSHQNLAASDSCLKSEPSDEQCKVEVGKSQPVKPGEAETVQADKAEPVLGKTEPDQPADVKADPGVRLADEDQNERLADQKLDSESESVLKQICHKLGAKIEAKQADKTEVNASNINELISEIKSEQLTPPEQPATPPTPLNPSPMDELAPPIGGVEESEEQQQKQLETQPKIRDDDNEVQS